MSLKNVLDSIGSVEAFDDVTKDVAELTEDDLETILKDSHYNQSAQRVRAVGAYLNEQLADKDAVIPMLLAATIARVPLVLLGLPGTAKSQLVRSLCEALHLRAEHRDIADYNDKLRRALHLKRNGGGNTEEFEQIVQELRVGERNLFEYLVTRFTTPEEIFGPTNIEAMLELSLFYRESMGMLPSTQIAFLDEIFKANGAILNALLSIINEKIYYNAGQAFNVNLLMVFGASNESPDTEELGALYDRFPIRVVSERVSAEKSPELLHKSVEYAYKNTVGGGANKTHQLASINDFRLLSRMIFVKYSQRGQLFRTTMPGFDFPAHFIELFTDLRDEFSISDRTPERLLRVAMALAMLDGSAHLEARHLSVFKYVAPNIESARILHDLVGTMIDGLAMA